MSRRAQKAFERINGDKIWTNVIGGANSVFMDFGFTPLVAWAIVLFRCDLYRFEQMIRKKLSGVA